MTLRIITLENENQTLKLEKKRQMKYGSNQSFLNGMASSTSRKASPSHSMIGPQKHKINLKSSMERLSTMETCEKSDHQSKLLNNKKEQ